MPTLNPGRATIPPRQGHKRHRHRPYPPFSVRARILFGSDQRQRESLRLRGHLQVLGEQALVRELHEKRGGMNFTLQ